MKPRVIGKGLQDKRTRIVRILERHARNLAALETLGPWTPPPRTWAPRPKQTREEWEAYWEMYSPPRYYSPREKPALAHPCPGPEAITEETMKAYIAVDPFVRGGLREATVRALCFIESFAPGVPRG